MFTKDSINWSAPTAIDEEDFPQDTLGRVQYAQFLTNFLKNEGYTKSGSSEGIKRNYVLNLNSEWGSGKTYFLKRWSEDLKGHFPTVYIDAWKQDYSDDPLMTVISSVINQLREQAGAKEDDKIIKVSNKIIGLLKAAAPGFARSISKRYFDIDPVAIMQAEEGNELGEVEDSDSESMDMSVMASNMVKHLIDEHDAKSNAIKDLKKNISQWVNEVIDRKKLNFPAFIFVDELDRCRPSYAVEMLETIKHIFDIKGIVFVVATDTEQLQHAVKAIYGEGFDARLYLGRFFNSRFSLKAPDLKDFLEVHVDHTKLSGDFLEERGIKILPPNPDGKVTLRNIAVILDAFKMPPRTAIQIADRVIATLSNMSKDSKIDILMLTTLLCFNEEDSKKFRKIISGNFSYKDKSNREQGIIGYIENRFNNYKSDFKMHFNPKIDHPKFNTAQRLSHENNYPEGTYLIPFLKYQQDLFSIYTSAYDGSTIKFSLLGTRGIEGTQYQRTQAQLYEKQQQRRKHEIEKSFSEGALWLEALYYQGCFYDVTLNKYTDYVELASALDWIDGDSDANDA
ncbi:P-loop NTPase fold protein [Marinomonas arenicola]|uniref:KAP family P-loop NTPase fold protein n=1 Tax=Marinomonas TaxID=28253 RepID=UPI0010552144|nr:P-loop NTPase fold protein [Marinomonas sp. KMM3893]